VTFPAVRPRARARLVFLLKLAVSVVLLTFVLSRLSWVEVRQALVDPRWPWLLVLDM